MNGWILLSFLLLIYYISKVEKLEKQVKKLEKKKKEEKEVNKMSKLIKDLVGKKCRIKLEENINTLGAGHYICDVLDVDDEWIKISVQHKKEGKIVALIRIDSIDNIQELATEQTAYESIK